MTNLGPATETAQLRVRLNRMAEEKAALHLVIRLLERLNPLASIGDLVRDFLCSIMDTVGGTNIKLYYRDEDQWHYADFLGQKRVAAEIDDPLARAVSETREFVEVDAGVENTLLLGVAIAGGWSWGFPLLVGEELVGVVVIENMHISARSIGRYLSVVVSHAALVLSNVLRRKHRELTEQALRSKTEELDSYFNGALDLFAIAGTDGTFKKLNPSWEQVLGYPLAELEGAQLLDFVHPEDRPATIGAIAILAEDRPVINFVNRYRHHDGSWRWIEWRSNARGGVIYAAARDITERLMTEESLRRWAQIFEHAQWGIAVGRGDGIVMVNPAFARERGYTVEEALRLSVRELFAPEVQAEVPGYIRQADVEEHYTFESKNVRKDGSVFPVWVDVSVMRDVRGGAAYRIVNVQDISERKRAEAELDRHRHHLAELVEVRTAELAQARDAAEAASRAKSAFLANMTHELRTPLNAILGFAALLERDRTLPDTARRQLGIIDRAGEHLLAMINEILDISRIESGRVEVRHDPFDLRALLEDLVAMVGSRARAKGLETVLEVAPTCPRRVASDAGKIRQVLLNVLSNAVKFTSVGSVTLRVRTTPLGVGSARLVLELEVADTGLGIPEAKRAAIFEPFLQVGTAFEKQEGTGLGLAIARSLTRLLGGEIAVESEVGRGSVFRIRIPVTAVESCEAVELEPPPRQVEGLEPGQPVWRVLIVEDHADNAALLAAILARVGFETRTAHNGLEGVLEAETWRPHFIWMDVRMPVMDGLEATRRVRALPGGAAIKIVLATASVFKDREDRILTCGCDGVVHKPFREWEVLAEMERQLGLRYRYSDQESGPRADAGVDTPGAAALAALGGATTLRIRQAAMELHGSAIVGLAEELEASHPTVARWLRSKASDYDFGTIVELLADAAGGVSA